MYKQDNFNNFNNQILDIDCSIPCHPIIKTLSSCPTRIINFTNPSSDDFHEILMIILSSSPYAASFIILLCGTYYRTTRSVLILLMVLIQNFMVEFLKNNLRDPRPNYKCNHQFGNPSNYTCFYTCIIIWFILETFFTEKKHQFQYKKYLFPLYIVYPFIIYSRYYLHYHTIEQIITGIILGVFVGIVWYFLSIKFILKSENPLKRILYKMEIKNTLTSDIIGSFDIDNLPLDDDFVKQYQNLLEKNEKLEHLKQNLRKITRNIKNMEFMKEQEKMMFMNKQDES